MLFCPSLKKWLSTLVPAALLFSSCQRELQNPDPDPPGTSGNTWVLKNKMVEGFATTAGHLPYRKSTGFYYDPVSMIIIAKDTNNDNQAYTEYMMSYDLQGRLMKVKDDGTFILKQEKLLVYDGNGLLEKVTYKDPAGATTHEGSFQWTQEGSGFVGHYTDPAAPGGVFSEGNRIFILNDQRKLMRTIDVSRDPAVGDQQNEVLRNAQQSVAIRKFASKENNRFVVSDSMVYTRETTYPSRLSSFYGLISKGITWFSDDYGISFMPSLHYYNEYFEYENDLAKKVVYYSTSTDPSGNRVVIKKAEINLIAVYDKYQNPVKLTVNFGGEKQAVITFVWQKISWVN